MKVYVLDSSAILIYLVGASSSSKIARLIQEGHSGEAQLCISAVNWAECQYIVTRREGAAAAHARLSRLARGLEVLPADQQRAERAGNLRCRFHSSLADCFAASLAIELQATLVTSDPDFELLKHEIKILRLEKPHE